MIIVYNKSEKGRRKSSERTIARNRICVGEKNPNWKGGKFGYSLVGWKEARRKVWERDKVCRLCEKPPTHRRLDVHHKKKRRDGGSDRLSNLVGLHVGCHKKVEMGKAKIQFQKYS